MNTAEITELEAQIENLIRLLGRLKTENQSLRNRLASSVRERSLLQEKQQKAVVKVKRIISQLREEAS